MKNQNITHETNKQIFDAITLIADQRNIPRDTVIDSLKDAITKSYVKEYPESELEVIIDYDNKYMEINQLFKVVEDNPELNDYSEITVKDAQTIDKSLNVGDTYKKPVSLADLSKLSLRMHLGQLLKHNVTSQSNKQIFTAWQPRIGEVIYAEVEKVDAKSGFVTVSLDGTFGFASRQETIPGEKLNPGQKYNFYIKDVKEQTKGWPIILSRADAGLVKYFLNINIPEIQEKVIEIRDIARIAGFKTKLSVLSHKPGIEAAGTVIGPRGSRIRTVQEQVNNEHIEVIEYSDDFITYITRVCSPAELVGVAITEPKTPEEKRYITLVTHPDKLALLIGKKGQNIRLISQLLKADVEVSTIEDARENGIEFQKIDMAAMRQQKFNSSYNKYRPGGANVLDQYNRPNYNRNAVNRNNPPIGNNQGNSTKKVKSSIFDDINKQDLLKDLQNVDTGQESGDSMEDDHSEK